MPDLDTIQIPLGPYVFDTAVAGPSDGLPVLLLHGFPETSWSWRFVQPALSEAGYRSAAPDLRGYSPGARPTEPSDYAITTLVADVIGIADHLGWERFDLVGHDWGGALAWQVAGRHPDRLNTLTVVSTPHPKAFAEAKKAGRSADGDDQAEKSAYMEWFRTPGSEHEILANGGETLRAGLVTMGRDQESADHYVDRLTDPSVLVGGLNWYRGADVTDSDGLGPITVPTLYVWSTEDVALGRTAAEATAAEVEGPYSFEVLDGISHWIPEEAPEALVGHLLPHLDAHR